MTDTPPAGRKEILGAGTLIGATFSIFFSRIMAVFALAIVPAIGLVVFQFLITPDEAAIDTNVVSFGGEGLSMPVAISVQAIVSALLVRMAYDARLGKPPLLGNYVSTTVSLIVPILGCSFVVVFVLFVVMLVIIVPGLMLAGTAPSPAIVIPFVLLGFAAMLYILAMW